LVIFLLHLFLSAIIFSFLFYRRCFFSILSYW
jgi:hypothetical protein